VIGKTEFAVGLGRIAIAVRQTLDAETVDVYHEALCDETETAAWEEFTRWAVKAGRFEWFPKLRELRSVYHEHLGGRPLLVECTEAYERVLEAGIYTAEGGTTWDYRSISEKCGHAAADAFLAAGGNAAFSNTFRESDRRERFTAAYAEAVRDEPHTRLLPARTDPKALPPAEEPPTREEAAAVVERLRDLAGVEAPAPTAPRVVVTDERLAELRRQAEEPSA
jgi:hypothetical protein